MITTEEHPIAIGATASNEVLVTA